ncbi:flagellar basal body-associated FliL family protein [Marinobacter sp. C2H3]|uniref:flagellar basal body-associated FliL family protein n=1 Tax=Marinobacter sp. C2H3 TaxID=3119003 RepID=UPI00300F254F
MKRRPNFLTALIAAWALLLTLPALAESEAANGEQAASEEGGDEAVKATDYIEMDPAFVTNVGQPGARATYLKASVTLRTSLPDARKAIEAHMPRLRHELVMLFGEQTSVDTLTSPDGQATLAEQAKERINAALATQQTEITVDEVLFTEFVVQR